MRQEKISRPGFRKNGDGANWGNLGYGKSWVWGATAGCAEADGGTGGFRSRKRYLETRERGRKGGQPVFVAARLDAGKKRNSADGVRDGPGPLAKGVLADRTLGRGRGGGHFAGVVGTYWRKGRCELPKTFSRGAWSCG